MHKPSSIKTTVYGRNNDKITGDIQKQLTLFYVTVYTLEINHTLSIKQSDYMYIKKIKPYI
jgi:hypothetical protein